MASYELSVDTESGVIVWRLLARIPDHEVADLERDMAEMMDAARTVWGRVRMLVDITAGPALASPALDGLAERVGRRNRPGDRRAMMVASSLDKIATKARISEESGVFLSESAAMTWLTAWDEVRLPTAEMCRV